MQAPDRWGALVAGAEATVEATASGPLSGTTFVVKDVFDVEGQRTGGGNPDLLAATAPATRTAPAVEAVLGAGARLVGRAITDEFTWSLAGTNAHYGTPKNPKATGRIPGGSSSGSAVAVASGMVAFALGTDTAGSVRVPASYCGIFGMRPTHGRISGEGVLPLAPTYDTVGWFAHSGRLLREVGDVLLRHAPGAVAPRTVPSPDELVVLTDGFALADAAVQEALAAAVDTVSRATGLKVTRHHFSPEGVRGWQQMADAYPVLMGPEAWHSHGEFISTRRPKISPDIAARFQRASKLSASDVRAVQPVLESVRRRVAELTAKGSILAVPAAPSVAPLLTTSEEDWPAIRVRTLAVGIVGTMSGAPCVSLPLADVNGLPVNLALIGPHGADEVLLDIAARLD
jgi:amidase